MVEVRKSTNQGSHNHTKHNRFAQHTKLFLQAIRINIQFRETRNAVKQPVDDNGKRSETLAERLRNADAVHLLIISLELLRSQVSHHQRDDVAHDGSKITPQHALPHHKISHSTDEGKMPVIPQIDVHRTCTLRHEQQEIDAKTDGDDERTHSRVVSHSGSSRPSHVKHLQVEVKNLRDAVERAVEVGGQQSRDDAKPHKTDTHIESALESLAKLHANAQTDNGEQDGHHDSSAQSDNIGKNFIHKTVS